MKRDDNNQPITCCAECADADEWERIASDIDTVLLPLLTFAADWECAPRGMRVDQPTAEYWWLLGRRAGRTEALVEQNADLAEMGRMMRERLR